METPRDAGGVRLAAIGTAIHAALLAVFVALLYWHFFPTVRQFHDFGVRLPWGFAMALRFLTPLADSWFVFLPLALAALVADFAVLRVLAGRSRLGAVAWVFLAGAPVVVVGGYAGFVAEMSKIKLDVVLDPRG